MNFDIIAPQSHLTDKTLAFCLALCQTVTSIQHAEPENTKLAVLANAQIFSQDIFVVTPEGMLAWSARETNIQNLGYIKLLKIYKTNGHIRLLSQQEE